MKRNLRLRHLRSRRRGSSGTGGPCGVGAHRSATGAAKGSTITVAGGEEGQPKGDDTMLVCGEFREPPESTRRHSISPRRTNNEVVSANNRRSFRTGSTVADRLSVRSARCLRASRPRSHKSRAGRRFPITLFWTFWSAFRRSCGAGRGRESLREAWRGAAPAAVDAHRQRIACAVRTDDTRL
jgi:hypothetical protein